MHNIQVTFDQSPNNARSESSIAIDPYNPLRIVAVSKKFFNPQTYSFTLAVSWSHDAGHTWHPCADLDIAKFGWAGISDPSITWDDQGNAYLLVLPFTGSFANNTAALVGVGVYKSTDGGVTWSKPSWVFQGDSDKQWIAADAKSGTAFQGRLYAAWDGNGLQFARSLDGGATWIGTGPVATASAAGSQIAASSFAPEVNVANDGTIYIAFAVFGSVNSIQLLVSKDGGDSFQLATAPATGITPLQGPFPNETFRVVTIPTACAGDGKTVAVAWADLRLGSGRIFYALSNDGGMTWTTGPSGKPLVTSPVASNLHHFHPQMVMTGAGGKQVIGCAYYEFGPKPTKPLIDVMIAISYDSGKTFHKPSVVTDQPWDPKIDAPNADANPNVTFIGDYFGIDVSANGFYPLWTDTRTQIQELFTDIVPYAHLAINPRFDAIVAQILVGIIQDGGGIEIVGGHIVRVPPWDPEGGPIRDIMYGLASYVLANGMSNRTEAHALQRAALGSVARMTQSALRQLGGTAQQAAVRTNGEQARSASWE